MLSCMESTTKFTFFSTNKTKNMTKEFIDNFAGQRVKLTMIDNTIFEGLLWFVNFEDEEEKQVHSISLDTYKFQFRPEHIKNIEIIK